MITPPTSDRGLRDRAKVLNNRIISLKVRGRYVDGVHIIHMGSRVNNPPPYFLCCLQCCNAAMLQKLSLDPGNSLVILEIAVALHRTGRTEEARQRYTEVILLDLLCLDSTRLGWAGLDLTYHNCHTLGCCHTLKCCHTPEYGMEISKKTNEQ